MQWSTTASHDRQLLRSFATLLMVATAGAAVVASVRQRKERREVHAGLRPAASAAAEVPRRHRYDRCSARLAAWQPTRPAGPASRLVATLWAFPLSLVGWIVATAAGRRPRFDATRGCWVATDVAGAARWAHGLIGADANTIGQVVVASTPTPSATLLDHEAMHARQAERLGLLMVPLYAWLGARYGYADHPLEVAARMAARAYTEQTPSGDVTDR